MILSSPNLVSFTQLYYGYMLNSISRQTKLQVEHYFIRSPGWRGKCLPLTGCQIPNKFFKERPRHYENNIGNFPAWYLFAGVQLMEHNLVLLRTPRVSLHFSRQPTWLVLLFFYVYHYV